MALSPLKLLMLKHMRRSYTTMKKFKKSSTQNKLMRNKTSEADLLTGLRNWC